MHPVIIHYYLCQTRGKEKTNGPTIREANSLSLFLLHTLFGWFWMLLLFLLVSKHTGVFRSWCLFLKRHDLYPHWFISVHFEGETMEGEEDGERDCNLYLSVNVVDTTEIEVIDDLMCPYWNLVNSTLASFTLFLLPYLLIPSLQMCCLFVSVCVCVYIRGPYFVLLYVDSFAPDWQGKRYTKYF